MSFRLLTLPGAGFSVFLLATTAAAQSAPPSPPPPPPPPGAAADSAGAAQGAPPAASAAPGSPPAGPQQLPPPGYAAPPPPPPGYGPPPGIYVEQPPPPPPVPRTRHLHDGFYLRLSVGAGALATESDFEDGGMSVSGGGAAFDLTLGGSPTPGLVIGGGFLIQEAFRPDYSYRSAGLELEGTASGSDSSMGFVLVGPMIDAFPNPNGGFHLGALLGHASVGLSDQNDNASSGFGLSAWVGYMWWVSSEWSLGGLLRLTGARTQRTVGVPGIIEVDIVDTTRAYSIMFSAAYH